MYKIEMGALVLSDISESFRVDEAGNHLTVIPGEKLGIAVMAPFCMCGRTVSKTRKHLHVWGPFRHIYWDLSRFFVQKKSLRIIVSGCLAE